MNPSADASPTAPSTALLSEIESRAIKLLTTREHSRLELGRKLRARGYPAEDVEQVLDRLEREDWLSESRLVERYVAERLDKGFGPVRIRFELREKGLPDEQIRPQLELDDAHYLELIARVHRQRFGDAPIADRNGFAKRARFLEYRGFPQGLITRYLDRLQRQD